MLTPSEILAPFHHLPRFSDGRIDFSHSAKAPVVSVFVKAGGEILLLKRSDKVRTYQGKWNTVAGYYDEPVELRAKILEELREEIGLHEADIQALHLGESFEFFDEKIGKTWIVHPALAVCASKPEISLDYEHSKYSWIQLSDLKNYDIVPSVILTLKKFNNLKCQRMEKLKIK